MSIQTTLGELVAAEDALKRVAALKLPVKSAYHVAKLIRIVSGEVRAFHEQRERFIRELGVTAPPNAHGEQTISVTPEQWPEFQRRIRELAAISVSIAWGPLTVEMFGTESVAPADLVALGPLMAWPGESESTAE